VLEERVNRIKAAKIKLPLIKRYLGERLKLKGFLTQIYFKVTQKGAKLPIPMDRIAYIGLFLLKRALK